MKEGDLGATEGGVELVVFEVIGEAGYLGDKCFALISPGGASPPQTPPPGGCGGRA